MQKIQENYQKRIDTEVTKLIENYHSLLKASKIGNDDAMIAKDVIAVETHSETIVMAGETLLKIISDMKQSLILNDFAQMNKDRILQEQKCSRATDTMNSALHDISSEVSRTLQALETIYYDNLETQRNNNNDSI